MVDTTNFNIVPNDDEEQFTVEFGEIMNTGVIDFNELIHRPKYNNTVMTGETSIPAVPSQISQLENNLNYQTETEVDAKIALEANVRQQADGQLQTTVGSLSNGLEAETAARQEADNNLQSQIDGISASSDVKDIVGTYAELQAYDTAHIKANDIVKVIQDETHNDAMSYYRWEITNNVGAWVYVGSEGPFYTKSETDILLDNMQNVFYGTCVTAGNVAEKVVVCPEFKATNLKEGTVLIVKFSNYNQQDNPTINVNATGAVNLMAVTGAWANNESVELIHDGTEWVQINGGLATTTIYGVTKLLDSSISTSTGSALVPKTLNDVLTSIVTGSSPYSTTTTYAVGDYCRYGSVVYRCNTTIVGGEAWTAAHWDAVDSLQEQLDNTETWTFELEGGTTVTKKVVVR